MFMYGRNIDTVHFYWLYSDDEVCYHVYTFNIPSWFYGFHLFKILWYPCCRNILFFQAYKRCRLKICRLEICSLMMIVSHYLLTCKNMKIPLSALKYLLHAITIFQIYKYFPILYIHVIHISHLFGVWMQIQ